MAETIFERMMRGGRINKMERELRRRVWAHGRVVDNAMLAWYALQCRNLGMDNHILTCGQNGTGKSFTNQNLAVDCMKWAGFKKSEDIFSDTSSYQLGNKLCVNEDTIEKVDELEAYLSNTGWNTRPQRDLMNSIGQARENRNMMLSATKVPHKINFEYRDNKVHTVIFLVDRDEDDIPFGFVLHSWAFVEQHDKFRLDDLAGAYTLPFLLDRVEDSPYFLGYYFADRELKFSVDGYRKLKRKAILRLGKVMEDTALREEIMEGGE